MIGQLRIQIACIAICAGFPLVGLAQNAAPAAGGNAAGGAAPAPNVTAPKDDAAVKTDAALKAAQAIMTAKPDPAVDTIVDSNPHTPAQLLQAAAVLADLGRVDLAKKYLQQLADAKSDENALAEAAGQIDPATLLRLANNADLQPAGRQWADAVLAAAANQARDPQRLQGEIDHLTDPSSAVQRAALKRILAAHENAVPALVLALADANRAAVQPLARMTLVKIGEQAVPPLVAALQTDSDALKVQIVDVLRQIDSPTAVLYLAAPATSEKSSPAVKAAARAALADIQGAKNPTAADAAKLLTTEIERYLKHDRPLNSDGLGNVVVWSWNSSSGALQRENLPSELASAVLTSRFAADLLELAPQNALAQRLYLISTLQAAQLRSGLDRELSDSSSTLAPALSQKQREQITQLGPAAMEDALSSAMSMGKLPAATAAAEILGTMGDRTLLEERNGKLRPLILAVQQGDRRLQFAAVQAIMKLKPTAPFAGSSQVLEALAFFADSPGNKRALVAYPNMVVAGQLAAMLAGLGYEVDLAANGRQAYLQAISSGDYELLVLSSRLDHPPLWVTLDLLRDDPRTAHVPVALLAEDADGDIDRMRILAEERALAAGFQRPVTPDGMKYFVDRLLDRAGGALVPEAVRLRQSLAALAWLAQLSEADPHDFNLMPYEAQLTRALHRPATSAAAAKLLGGLGKQTVQEALVDTANSPSEPLGMRQTAAAAFSQAVRKSGIQLTTVEIQHQYDRYNQSATEDKAAQQLLGLILDAIELPTKK
ncbi:MAG TPA: hypothetical protein VFE46_08820 [Pirellulales bacterium]|jgi:DNA-binding response OmpR family regulator|nr:hypothetical protein [Pirellulales bacterium]